MANCVTQCEAKKGARVTSDAILSCLSVTPRINETVAEQYVNAVSNPASGKFAEPTRCYAIACVRAGRLLYAKKKWSGYTGDCPENPKNVQPGKAALTAKASGLASGVASTAGAYAAAGSGLAAALSVATLGLGLIAIPFAIIGHHSAMVEAEQKSLCAAANFYNDFASYIENELRAGTMPVADAVTLQRNIRQQIADGLQPLYKSCNFACGFIYALDCIIAYNENEGYAQLQSTGGKIREVFSNPAGIAVAAGTLFVLARAIFGGK